MVKFILLFIFSVTFIKAEVETKRNNWETLTITRFCAVDKKFCEDKLHIDKLAKISFTVCKKKSQAIKIDDNLIDKIKDINEKVIRDWSDDASHDTACGYLIKLDDSKDNYIYLDKNPDLYERKEIKEYIQTLNQTFDKLK